MTHLTCLIEENIGKSFWKTVSKATHATQSSVKHSRWDGGKKAVQPKGHPLLVT